MHGMPLPTDHWPDDGKEVGNDFTLCQQTDWPIKIDTIIIITMEIILYLQFSVLADRSSQWDIITISN